MGSSDAAGRRTTAARTPWKPLLPCTPLGRLGQWEGAWDRPSFQRACQFSVSLVPSHLGGQGADIIGAAISPRVSCLPQAPCLQSGPNPGGEAPLPAGGRP